MDLKEGFEHVYLMHLRRKFKVGHYTPECHLRKDKDGKYTHPETRESFRWWLLGNINRTLHSNAMR